MASRGLTAVLLPLTIALTLSGCGTPPSKPAQPVGDTPTNQEQVEPDREPTTKEQSHSFILEGIREQLAAGEWLLADSMIEAMDPAILNVRELPELALLKAQLAYGQGDVERALKGFAAVRQTQLSLPLKQQATGQLRTLLRGRGNFVRSARLGVDLLDLELDGQDRESLLKGIWTDLSVASEQAIRAELGQSRQPNWRPWLELALLTKTAHPGAGGAPTSLENWLSHHRRHPAAAIAGGLANNAATPPPTRVNLMLPLTGNLAPAAKSIRDGYLAAYYRLPAEHRPALEIIDTGHVENITQAYLHAVAGGAQLVIGPLEKHRVSQIAALADRPVPVIALNRINVAASESAAPLLQLALAPEDEARQLAQVAFSQGIRRPILIRPASTWGDEMSAALLDQWRALGGELVAEARYSSQAEISDSIKAAMAIDTSEQRAARARRLMGVELTAFPRRRQDLDGVFLLARTPREARSIKPLLAFHYAANLPVYATSSVYGGEQDRRDRDLEGTRLLEIPWLLQEGHILRDTLARAQDAPASLSRLQALGTDALLLQQHLPLVVYSPWAIIPGATGTLAVDSMFRINRRLHLATIDDGVLKAGH